MLQHEAPSPSQTSRVPASPPARRPGIALRLSARVRWFSLDARLAAGEDPSRSPLLAARAARLTAPRHREQLAAALNGLLLAAQRPARISRVSPNRSALLRNEAEVHELARRVEFDAALYARGLARLERLLSDSTGPAFRGDADHLAAELARIDAELSGAPSPAPAPPFSGRAGRSPSIGSLARMRSGDRARSRLEQPGFAGGSFALPDGSWFHGRRESS